MEILIKTINGWTPPSPVKCTPRQITQVDSETNTVGDLIIKKILSVKMAFEVEWKYLTASQVQRICSELSNFDARIVYKDFSDGQEKTGYFYPGDRQPVPSVVYKNGEIVYETFPLNIIQK